MILTVFSSPIASGDAIEFDIKSTGCKGDHNNHVKFLEHIQLYSTIEYSRRGDLHINVTSPMGKYKI